MQKSMDQALKRILGYFFKPLRNSVTFANAQDARRFNTYSQTRRTLEQLPVSAAQADLLRKMHSLEKGLALPEPAHGFGVAKAEALIDLVENYRDSHGDDWYVATCTGVLREYAEFQRAHGHGIAKVDAYLSRQTTAKQGGTILIDKTTVQKCVAMDFGAFARSRHSIRNFSQDPVHDSLILEAIDIARKTPSVCNRSSGRVYLTADRADIDAALDVQGGSRGFSQTIPNLLIVASDVTAFYKLGERNQPWIDGGLFAMSLVYALHGLGLGTCMLNWSKTPSQDRRLRRRFHIHDHHNIIMMIAVGHLPDQVRVALSPRAGIDSFFQKLERRKL